MSDTDQDTDGFCHCGGPSQGQEAPHGMGRSVGSGVPCAETVLVAIMSDGSYLLVGYPQGEPAAFVARDDAGPLRQALQAAFGCSKDDAAGGDGNSIGTMVPGRETPHTKQAHL